jgi:prepilin-type N-terminal cleavage/methylation domain-containing protein
MPLTRRGFALIELLVATLLGAMLAVLVGRLLLGTAAMLRDRSERMGLEHSLRVSVGSAQAMLEPLGIDPGSGADLSSAGPSSLVARVIRGSGVLCDAAPDRLTVRAGPGSWRGLRVPVQNRDSLIVASVMGAEHWIPAPLLGTPSAGICPDGSLALVLPTSIPASSLAAIGAGSPLQVFEPVELRLYPSSGASWVGLRLAATGEAIQPLAGPFSSAGPGLDYRDLQGNAAPADIDVAMVLLSLEGLTERAGGVGVSRLNSVHSDSVTVAVALRGRQ